MPKQYSRSEVSAMMGRALSNAPLAREAEFLSGKLEADGSITLAGSTPGKFWARPSLTSRAPVEVWGQCWQNNISFVALFNKDNEWQYDRPAASINAIAAGEYASAAFSPALNSDITPTNITGQGFTPGRVRPSTLGGLIVTIEAFAYISPTGLSGIANTDLTLTPTASAGMVAVVYVLFDPRAGTFSQQLGPDYPAAFSPTIDDAYADLDIDHNLMVMAAVPLVNGAAGVTLIYDMRAYTSPTLFDYVNFGVQETQAIAAGAIALTKASNYILQAETGTADTLTTISGGIEGQTIELTADTGDTITIDVGGNLILPNSTALTIDSTLTILLTSDGTNWKVIGGSGGGGGSIAVTDGTTTVSPTTTLEFPPGAVANGGGGLAQISFPTGGATLLVPEVIFEDTLVSADWWDIQNSDLTGGLDFEDYDFIDVIFPNAKSTANVTADDLYMFLGTGGGALDTTLSHYFVQLSGGVNGGVDVTELSTPHIGGIAASHASTPAGYASSLVTRIFVPGSTATHKRANGFYNTSRSAGVSAAASVGYAWHDMGAITRIGFRVGSHGSGGRFVAGSRITLLGYRVRTVGTGDLDIAAVGSITATSADKVVLGDVSNADNTSVSTVEEVLKLSAAEITSTSTGNIDDFAIGTAPMTLLRMNNASDATLRGMAAGYGGQQVTVVSVGAGNVYLAHQNAGSAAANQLFNFITSANTALAAGSGVATYVYDATTQRWRLEEHTQGAAIAYTPAWTVSSGSVSVGNGTLTGSYTTVGRKVFVSIALLMGSSSTFGSGAYRISAPITIPAAGLFGTLLGTARVRDNSPATNYVGVVYRDSGGGSVGTVPHAGTQVSTTSPMTWSQDDTWDLEFIYEAD